MPNFTYPGVYSAEQAGAPAPVQGVSPSTLGLLSFATKGPVNTPTLVTGMKEFERIFGGFISASIGPTTLHAFFKNGGGLCYFNRVVGSGASKAKAYISEPVTAEAVGTGDGAAVTFAYSAVSTPIEPGTYTATDTVESFTDGAAGVLTGSAGGSGTINYNTGAVSLTFNAAPANAQAITAAYSQVLWEVDFKWEGVDANNFRIELIGSDGFEADATATFTRWILNLQEQDADGNWLTVESFDGMDFVTSSSVDFFPTVMNDTNAGSDIITIVDVGNTGVPSSLAGVSIVSEAIGSGTGTQTVFTGTLASGSCHPTTLSIAAPTGVSVTDDGNGNLIGNVDASGVNTIDYATGVYSVTFSVAPDSGASNILASYYSAGAINFVDAFAGGLDGAAITSAQVIGATNETNSEGIFAFNKLDDILILAVPDFAGDGTVDGALLDYAQARTDRFVVLSTPLGQTPSEAVNHKKRTLNKNNNSYGAIYHPWVKILDPVTSKALLIPPIGHVAGVYARTDSNKNVGKAPAGATDGALKFIIGLEAEYTRAEVGILNTGRVNALVNWPQVGNFAVWGARTLQVGGEFGYIQTRRLFMFVEKSVFNAVHVHVFESNGSELWVRIRAQVSGFLESLFGQKYLAGNSPAEAFFVTVDSTNNPQSDIDAGILNVDVGIAGNKPAEFISFRYSPKLPG